MTPKTCVVRHMIEFLPAFSRLQDLWYLDHNMYYVASHTIAQSQGNRSYQEDRFVAFSKLKMHERVVELIETYGDRSVATAVATPKQIRIASSRRKSGGSSSNSSREPSPKTRGKRKTASRKDSPDEVCHSSLLSAKKISPFDLILIIFHDFRRPTQIQSTCIPRVTNSNQLALCFDHPLTQSSIKTAVLDR
jgi:hypothetical protein